MIPLAAILFEDCLLTLLTLSLTPPVAILFEDLLLTLLIPPMPSLAAILYEDVLQTPPLLTPPVEEVPTVDPLVMLYVSKVRLERYMLKER